MGKPAVAVGVFTQGESEGEEEAEGLRDGEGVSVERRTDALAEGESVDAAFPSPASPPEEGVGKEVGWDEVLGLAARGGEGVGL